MAAKSAKASAVMAITRFNETFIEKSSGVAEV
jgi:hypothetical protein